MNVRYSQFSLLFLFVFLTACFGRGGNEPAEEAAQLAETVLLCTPACADQGQCGKTEDGRDLVLGHTERPETRNHNLTLPVNTPITVQLKTPQQLRLVTGAIFEQTFSLITINENGVTGWVPDWCISSPPGQ